ncbi:MAG: pirin family protein [Acidimicrobiia bacterium]
MVADPVLQVVPLEFQWPTADPFLFCVHHFDVYPAANEHLGPATSLAGRAIGSDFAGIDGWRMYHGTSVPGFPQHPHRGFETVTFVRQGLVDHSDSLGATARFGRGDVQWLTAGRGIVHSEMFPLVDREHPNPCELFQIWLNLPSVDKMVEPSFTMLWNEDLPRLLVADPQGHTSQITIIAGELAGVRPPPPPPDSWAARPEADVAIWHLALAPNAHFDLPSSHGPETRRTLYVFEGDARVGDHDLAKSTGAGLRVGDTVRIIAGSAGTEALVLQGRPIAEPIVQRGPFVMNDRAGVEQAFVDYQATEFGGWPWTSDEPVHRPDVGRFARHPDGHCERPALTPPQAERRLVN